jgi:hypothetical protein
LIKAQERAFLTISATIHKRMAGDLIRVAGGRDFAHGKLID